MKLRNAVSSTRIRKSRGFSLVELMVALAAGLIVSAAAVAFLFSSMQSNTAFVGITRLTQELRNNMDFVNRELRRAGYDEDALLYVALPPNSVSRSPFSTILVTNDGAANSCILYAYDKATGNRGQIDNGNGERHGIRRVVRTMPDNSSVGVLEVADSNVPSTPAAPTCAGASPDYSNTPPACNTTSGWCALSDPKKVNVTAFTITSAANNININPSGSGFGTLIRDMNISIAGTLIDDSTVSQTINSSVKIRADCLHSNSGTTQCDIAP